MSKRVPLSRIEFQLEEVKEKLSSASSSSDDYENYTDEELEDELSITEQDAKDIFDQAKNGIQQEDDMTITEDDARDIFDNAQASNGGGNG